MTPKELHCLRSALEAHMAATQQSMRSFASRAGLNADAIRDILRGKSVNPKFATLEAIAQTIGVSVDVLLGRKDSQLEAEPVSAEDNPTAMERITSLLTEMMRQKYGSEVANTISSFLFKPTAPGSKDRQRQNRIWNTAVTDLEKWVIKIKEEFEADDFPPRS